MTVQIIDTPLSEVKTECVVVGLYTSGKLNEAGKALDDITGGKLTALYEAKDHQGEAGSIRMLYDVAGTKIQKIVIVGLGKEDELSPSTYRKAITAVITAMRQTVKHILITLTDCQVKDHSLEWHFMQVAEVAQHALYNVALFKTDEESKKPFTLVDIDWYLPKGADKALAQAGREKGRAIAAGVQLTRELGDLPANYCTPTFLSEQAKSLAEQYQFQAEVLDQEQMEALGMGALLAVAKGSNEPPKFIILQTGKKTSDKPIVLVGKGITFDSGGISLKPCTDMDEMKYDMCGAATVLGVFRAIGELGLDMNVIGVIPSCENMPSGHATRPGDILTSLEGKTIEVLNTDAEGRLILCDALAYAQRFEPKAIVDIATLTGACVIALGYHASGLMGNNDELIDQLLEAGNTAFDRAWQLPLWPEFQEQIKGRFADIINSAGRDGGTITAACFLSRFVKEIPWAHLDIAGTASLSGKSKGATGRPVPLLVTYLLKQAGQL